MKLIPFTAYEEARRARVKLLLDLKRDMKLRKATLAVLKEAGGLSLFARNFVEARKDGRFFEDWIPETIPFMPFEYQIEFFNQAEEAVYGRKSCFIEKSRQMGFSWMLAMVALYFWLFHNKSVLIVANKMEDVDNAGDINSFFEKIRYMIRGLPQWLLPPDFPKESGDLYNKRALLARSDSSAVIAWDSSNSDAGRWGTYDIVIFDEMASTRNAKEMNTALSATTQTMFYNSTPKGKLNEYYRVRERAYADLELSEKQGREARFLINRTHWKEHPCYDQEWYNNLLLQYEHGTVAQEYDIDYSAQVAGRVYPDFEPPTIRISQYKYDYSLPLYCSIDNSHGGADPHALVFFQTDSKGLVYIVDGVEFPGHTDIDTPASLLAKKPVSGYVLPDKIREWYDRYQDYKMPIFIADPYDTDTTHNNSSIRSIYAKHGVNLTIPSISKGLQGNISEQIRITRSYFPLLRVDEEAQTVILSMSNARYPERKEGSQSTQAVYKPIHDWTSHTRTAVEYFFLFLHEERQRIQANKNSYSNTMSNNPNSRSLVTNSPIYGTTDRVWQNRQSILNYL